MMKRNNNVEEIKDTKTKWETFKENSKVKYEEIMVDLKNPVKKAVRRRKVTTKAVSILRTFIFIGLSFVIIFPIFREISQALMQPADYTNYYVYYIPTKPTLMNIRLSLLLLNYWHSLWCTIRLSAISTICQLFATSLAGYAFARLKFKGSNIIFWIFMLTLIVPPQAVSIARAFYLNDFDILAIGKMPGIFESLLGHTLKLKGIGKEIVFYITSLTGQGIRAALFIYLFRQFFRGIPIELEESAQIDGAGVGRTFLSVMLPNARGIIVTVALFAFVWQWNDSYYAGMYGVSSPALDGNEFMLLTRKLLHISEWIGNTLGEKKFAGIVKGMGESLGKNIKFQGAVINTAALLSMLPLLIGYLFVQRLFIEGVERSGIVG